MPAECARSKLKSHMAKRLLQKQSLRTGAASSAGVFAKTHAHVDLHLDLETVGVVIYTSMRLCAHMFSGSFSVFIWTAIITTACFTTRAPHPNLQIECLHLTG